MINILHITPNFNYCCGRSKLVHLYLEYFANNKNYSTYFITNGGDSIDRLNALPNVQYDLFKFSTGIKNIFYAKKFYGDLKTYVLKNKIDIVHTHHRFPESIAVIIGKKLNIKTVLSTHGFTSGYKKMSYKSDKIISVSKSMTDYLINNFDVNELFISTIYNPVEFQLQDETGKVKEFRDQMDINEESKILLFVGRITKEKGHDSLLKSFELVGERYKNSFLIMNGQLNENGSVYKSIVKNNKIILVPPQKNIGYLYSIADIVILPSRIDSFPFVMIEAGSFKKPFIGGNTGGIAEFIEHGKNGLLVDPENPEQLAEKIIYLMNNPDIAKRQGEKLYEKVNRLCDYNKYFNEVEKIYNSLLSSK